MEPITAKEPLIAHLASGSKPPESWRIGTEHEKFGFCTDTLKPIPYEGVKSIRRVFEGMSASFGWEPVLEDGQTIALIKGDASITLEPGGQVELSGSPLETIHQTQDEINVHLQELAAVCRHLQIAFVGVGAQPKWPFDAIPWMPKARYAHMRAYLPTRGDGGLDMMCRTATVQANLDFSDERDMVAKFRLALALQPLTSALFANSPFLDGKPTGLLSARMEIWTRTDPDRCGPIPFVFKEGFGFEQYVDWALDAPMFFLYREGGYQDVGAAPFRAFLEGKLPGHPGLRPTLDDWALHLSTLFPDVRLKNYLEMRGADAGNSKTLCALPAFWKGVLYDKGALEGCWDLVRDWNDEERREIHRLVPRLGLKTPIPGGGDLGRLAASILDIAREGLVNQDRRNENGCDESVFLEPLLETAESGRTPAERLLEAYRGRWGESVDPIFMEQEFESFYADCRATSP